MSKSSPKRDGYLLKVYGITEKQYLDLLKAQDGGCGVCGKTPEEEGRNLAVDHNHHSGEIRGILCAYCNHRRIGRHRDSDLLRRMADYLERHTGYFVPAKPKKKRKVRKRR